MTRQAVVPFAGFLICLAGSVFCFFFIKTYQRFLVKLLDRHPAVARFLPLMSLIRSPYYVLVGRIVGIVALIMSVVFLRDAMAG
jgi:hypothetical protein